MTQQYDCRGLFWLEDVLISFIAGVCVRKQNRSGAFDFIHSDFEIGYMGCFDIRPFDLTGLRICINISLYFWLWAKKCRVLRFLMNWQKGSLDLRK